MVFLLTWLLRELAFTNSHVPIQAKFLWDCLFAPSLKLYGFDALSLKQEISAGILLDASPSFTCSIPDPTGVDAHKLSSISKDLFTAVNSCISALIVPITSGLFHSSELTTMYELINVDLSRKYSSPSLNIDMIRLLMPSTENDAISTTNDLSGALDIYLSLTCMENIHYHKVLANAVTKFRRFALRNVMVPKLRHDVFPREKKIRILELLKQVLDVEPLSKECVEHQDFEVNVNGKCNGFLDLSDCCYIVNALSLCIIDWHAKPQTHDNFPGQVFLCCKHVLKLKIEAENMSLLAYCRINASYNDLASYFKVTMEWIMEVGVFFTCQLWKDSMKYFCYLTGTNEKNLDTKKMEADNKVLCRKIEHWQSLVREKEKLEKDLFKTGNDSTRILHSYRKTTREIQVDTHSSRLTLEASLIESANDFIVAYIRI